LLASGHPIKWQILLVVSADLEEDVLLQKCLILKIATLTESPIRQEKRLK
jgi:hypothetical protein